MSDQDERAASLRVIVDQIDREEDVMVKLDLIQRRMDMEASLPDEVVFDERFEIYS